MAVLNAQYKHPTSSYSQGLKTLIDSMLKVNPHERPDIQQVPLFLCSNYDISTHVISGPWCGRGPAPLRMTYPIRELSISLSFSTDTLVALLWYGPACVIQPLEGHRAPVRLWPY